MREVVWEDLVSLNSGADVLSRHVGTPATHLALDTGAYDWDRDALPLERAVAADTSPLPTTEDREGYYGADHFGFWASGIIDMQEIQRWAGGNGLEINSYLDFGCATGRVLRAFAAHTDARVIGCDINRSHVDWLSQNLPPEVEVFQNTSLPTLPIPDASVDLITAYSVFTHIEAFDTTWLAEFRRILRPGGVAWLTFHGERTWREVKPGWPLHAALVDHPDYRRDARGGGTLPRPRTIYRWATNRSYSANVFYSDDYIRTVWGRLLDVVEVRQTIPPYQDVAVLRRPA